MRQARIQGVHRRRKVSTTRRNPAQAVAPDLVCREFTADGPDRLWVADITYIPTKAGFLYLAAVIDIWSRRVVGWSMRDDLATPLVTNALDMAITGRRPDQVIHHSDRGSQYTSTAFGTRCRQAGIAISMGRRGDAYDNAVAESFFATLETELLMRTSFANRNQARSEVFDYIEGFYNHTGGIRPSDTTHPPTTKGAPNRPNYPANPQTETVHKSGAESYRVFRRLLSLRGWRLWEDLIGMRRRCGIVRFGWCPRSVVSTTRSGRRSVRSRRSLGVRRRRCVYGYAGLSGIRVCAQG